MAVNTAPLVSGPIVANLAEDGLVAWVSAVTNVYDDFFVRAVGIPALPAGVTYDTTFGAFVIDSFDATWQALGAGQVGQVRIDYAVTDGEFVVPHALIINMTGVNDAAVIGGIGVGAVAEDSVLTTSGQLLVQDVDAGEAAFAVSQTPLRGGYGSLVVEADGRWTYTLDNASAAVQALNDGDQMADVFTVRTIDGTAAQISVTIAGETERLIAGTAGNDILTGGEIGEILMGLGGRDRLLGNGGADVLDGGAGIDSLYGGAGDDVIVFDANDRVQDGGAGNDVLRVSRSATVNLGATDQVSGDAGVTTGFENVEGIDATAALVLTGSAGANILAGGSAGDRLTGGLGADVLIGNGGADRFIYRSLAETIGDEIADFTHRVDRIDVSAIDAITGGSNNAFSFIGGAAFSRAGQLRYDQATGQVQGDVNGDRVADLILDIGAGRTITASDFVL